MSVWLWLRHVSLLLILVLAAGCAATSGASTGRPVGPSSIDRQPPLSTLSPSEDSAGALDEEANVMFEGRAYTCDVSGDGRYLCTQGASDIYCDSLGADARCSAHWYPDELRSFEVVAHDGAEYLCSAAGECQAYQGGPPPSAVQADVWCDDEGCVGYDPGQWFEVDVELNRFLCRDARNGPQQHDCYDYAGGAAPIALVDPDLYCSGSESFPNCSEYWYPSELAVYEVVEFDGATYICSYGECMAYQGGRPPSVISADLWCDAYACSEYDPDRWFEVAFGFGDYLCEDAVLGFQRYDCYEYRGGAAAASAVSPDVYCSGSSSFPECSEDWYPDDLESYEFVTIDGRDHVCENALLGGWGDYDCGPYSGGDPDFVWTGSMKCTSYATGFECNPDYYPSEVEGIFFVTIDFRQHVCQDTWQGYECFAYWSGSPRSAIGFWPDYYCNSFGCSSDGYP